jgi:hypothetical protein
MNRKIVCAAVRKDALIICGVRHFDAHMRQMIRVIDGTYTGWEQGFVDDHGEFVTREVAYVLACESGQCSRTTGVHELFSEDLY